MRRFHRYGRPTEPKVLNELRKAQDIVTGRTSPGRSLTPEEREAFMRKYRARPKTLKHRSKPWVKPE